MIDHRPEARRKRDECRSMATEARRRGETAAADYWDRMADAADSLARMEPGVVYDTTPPQN